MADQREKLAREEKDIKKRIERLIGAIEAGGPSASLTAKVHELETRQEAVRVEARSLHPIPRLEPSVIENRLAEWRRLLRQSTTQGRTILTKGFFAAD